MIGINAGLKQKVITFIKEFVKTDLFGKLKRYLITGSISFIIEYSLFYVLYVILDVWYLLANTIVYIIAFWFGFLMYKFWAFKVKGNTKRQLILYLILFAFNIFAVTGMMYLFSDIAGISPLISKVMVMFVIVMWNFTIYRKVIYK